MKDSNALRNFGNPKQQEREINQYISNIYFKFKKKKEINKYKISANTEYTHNVDKYLINECHKKRYKFLFNKIFS